MNTKNLLIKLVGVSLVAAFILASCGSQGNVVATAIVVDTPTASPVPAQVMPTATATLAPVATDTPVPTVAPTATTAATAAPTVSLVAQVIPSLNAYCRKGPGTGYDPITFLTNGVAYNVVGRNSLNTWWLVQVPGNLTCWMGDPGASLQGPVAQAPIVLAPPQLNTPSLFVGSYVCNTTSLTHTLGVSLNWAAVDGATGYRLYRNGEVLAEVAPTITAYHDNAPLKVDLLYELEAFNQYGVANRLLVRIPACG